MLEEDIEYLWLQEEANFSWLTGARGFVSLGAKKSRGQLLISHDKVTLVTNNIEASRLMTEELNDFSIDVKQYNWWEQPYDILSEKGNIATDISLGTKIHQLRWQLGDEEMDTYRKFGKLAAESIAEVCSRIRPNITEYAAAGMLADACISRGLTPSVLLVGADDRVFLWRHPLPTNKSIEKYALVVLGVHVKGLYISCSRLVHFGNIGNKIKTLHDAVCWVDAIYNYNTEPGKKLGEVFNKGIEAYEVMGYHDEWKNHHQGGMTGYAAREVLAGPNSQHEIKMCQAYAWNPSIAGTKSEDTFLVNKENNEVVTISDNFPQKKFIVENKTIYRPDILVRHIYY